MMFGCTDKLSHIIEVFYTRMQASVVMSSSIHLRVCPGANTFLTLPFSHA